MHPDSWFQSWPSLHYLTIRSGPVRALERMVTLGQGLGLAMSLLSWVGGDTFQDYRNLYNRSNMPTIKRSPPSTPWSPLLGLWNYSLLRQTHRCPGSIVGQFTSDQCKMREWRLDHRQIWNDNSTCATVPDEDQPDNIIRVNWELPVSWISSKLIV